MKALFISTFLIFLLTTLTIYAGEKPNYINEASKPVIHLRHVNAPEGIRYWFSVTVSFKDTFQPTEVLLKKRGTKNCIIDSKDIDNIHILSDYYWNEEFDHDVYSYTYRIQPENLPKLGEYELKVRKRTHGLNNEHLKTYRFEIEERDIPKALDKDKDIKINIEIDDKSSILSGISWSYNYVSPYFGTTEKDNKSLRAWLGKLILEGQESLANNAYRGESLVLFDNSKDYRLKFDNKGNIPLSKSIYEFGLRFTERRRATSKEVLIERALEYIEIFEIK